MSQDLTNLEGLQGKLSVHLWARDLYNNAVQKDYPDSERATEAARQLDRLGAG